VAAKAVIAAATAKVTVTASDGSTSQVDAYEKTKQDVDKAAGDAQTALEAISASDLKSKKTAEKKRWPCWTRCAAKRKS
jgi:hypothetical protein